MFRLELLPGQIPAPAEYMALRQAAGLSAMSDAGAAIGLAGSWYAVCVRRGDELVGMGRVIGDGGLFFTIVDIAVQPRFQQQGWGKQIMQP